MSRRITLHASDFDDLDGFYTAVYNLMELYEDWQPAHNLDAFNDMLYSGFGKDKVILVWEHSEKSAANLGLEATRQFYQHKIDQGRPYNVPWAKEQLKKLNTGEGATLFELIVEILQSHAHIELVLS